MTTIDHISPGVADVPSARAFYVHVPDALGIRCLAGGDGFAAFGRDRISFLLLYTFDGRPAGAGAEHRATQVGSCAMPGSRKTCCPCSRGAW